MEPTSERDKRWSFGTALSAVASAMDEQRLSKAQALKLLARMLGRGEQPVSVVVALKRLKAVDEGQLQLVLGQESLKFLDLLR